MSLSLYLFFLDVVGTIYKNDIKNQKHLQLHNLLQNMLSFITRSVDLYD